MQLQEELQDELARLPVQVPRGLVGQQELRTIGQGPGHGHPLLLPSRHLGRAGSGLVGQPDLIQHLGGPAQGLGPFPAPDHERQGHVFEGREFGQKVEELEDEADFLVADPGQIPGIPGEDVDAVDIDRPFGRPVQSPQEIEEGGLADAGDAHDRGHVPLLQLEAQAPEDLQDALGIRVIPAQIDRADQGFIHI